MYVKIPNHTVRAVEDRETKAGKPYFTVKTEVESRDGDKLYDYTFFAFADKETGALPDRPKRGDSVTVLASIRASRGERRGLDLGWLGFELETL